MAAGGGGVNMSKGVRKMKLDELEQKVNSYALTVLAPKAKSWSAKFALGAGSVGMKDRIGPFVEMTGAMREDGEIDMDVLHRVVMAGFQAAGHVDLFGGIVGFDPQDAEDLFTYLGK